jgi:hypothetical protein
MPFVVPMHRDLQMQVPDGNQGGGSPGPAADSQDDMMVGVAVGVAALAVLMLFVLILVRRNRKARKGVYVIHDRSTGGAAAATAPLSTVTVVDAGVLFFDETEDGANDTTGALSLLSPQAQMDGTLLRC